MTCIILSWSFVVILGVVSGLLDFDELKNVYYGIDILDTPRIHYDDVHHDAVILSSKYGQLYQCTVPQVLSLEDSQQPTTRSNNQSVVELLAPMKTLPCLFYSKGWWTYEFCYGREVKQYHSEDGKIVGNTIFLGHFEVNFSWSNNSEEHKLLVERYHREFYTKGSYCDLTNTARTTEVRFRCQEGHGDYISGVDEYETCSYIVTVHTNRICSHPQFGPSVNTQSVSISCQPLLIAEDYDIYMQDKTFQETVGSKETEAAETASSTDSLQKLLLDSFVNSVQSLLETREKSRQTAAAAADVTEKMELSSAEQSDSTTSESASSIDTNINTDTDTEDVMINDANNDDDDGTHEVHGSTDRSQSSVDNNGDDDDDDAHYDENDELLRQFDKELNEIAPDDQHKAHLSKYKETIKSSMQSQFSDILDEAESDMSKQGDDVPQIDTQDVFQKLTQTLNVLLDRLDKMDTDVSKSSSSSQETVSSSDETTENDEKSVIIESSQSKRTEDDEETVDVKVELLNEARNNERNDDVSEQSMENDEESIVGRIRHQLERAGLDTARQKIEFRVLSADNILHNKDSSNINKVIIAIVDGNDAPVKEQQRYHRLEANYRFKWDKSKNKQKNTNS